MRSKAVFLLTTALVLLVSSPAYAAVQPAPEPPPSDNGRWVAVISFVVFVAVVGGLLFIANAYNKNDHRNQ